MTTLTLLVKASHGIQLRHIDELLHSEFEELDLETKVLGNSNNKWVQVSIEGEDEAIAANFIRKKIGVCPISLDQIEDGSTLKGYISKVDLTRQELKVDVGIFHPEVTQAVIPLSCLREQLFSGEKADLKKIIQDFAVAEGLPIHVKVCRSEDGMGAELAFVQVEKFLSWKQSLLDRLIVLGALKASVEDVLERTRLNRDVIDVEELGLFEHALTCKLGTDAAGLIPRLGRYMRYSIFVVFNAKKIVVLSVNKD